MARSVGLIGHGLRHSISPAFQQAAFDHLGLDVSYELWETEPGRLRATVERMREASKLGANVTIPYKEAVLALVDEADDAARRIGAVNTVCNREGRLLGSNTDAPGFLRALIEDGGFEPGGGRAVVLGAGGAARAVSFALVGAGVSSLTVVNRTLERAQALASSLAAPGVDVVALSPGDERIDAALAGCDLVVNCTSVGLKGGPSEGQTPLEARRLPGRALIYDLVYNPIETRLLHEAGKAGARTLGGLPMLVYQGAASFGLWTGVPAPVDIMMKAARKALEGR